MNATRMYQALLRLYPRDYAATFGPEMARAFERAGEETRARSQGAYARFALAELAGLAAGAGAEWFAKLTTSSSVRGRCLPDLQKMRPAGVPREVWFAGAGGNGVGIPSELQEAQSRVELCLRRMEHAIATHDFQGARFYSNEDLKARETLRLLREKHGMAETGGR
jgi:hypothetical protein